MKRLLLAALSFCCSGQVCICVCVHVTIVYMCVCVYACVFQFIQWCLDNTLTDLQTSCSPHLSISTSFLLFIPTTSFVTPSPLFPPPTLHFLHHFQGFNHYNVIMPQKKDHTFFSVLLLQPQTAKFIATIILAHLETNELHSLNYQNHTWQVDWLKGWLHLLNGDTNITKSPSVTESGPHCLPGCISD